jgi:TonB family protein
MYLLRSTEISLALLAACSVKMTCLLAFVWIIARVAHRRSAGFRHLVWSLGILGSLILPLLTLLLPAWHSVTLRNASQFLSSTHRITLTPSSGTFHSTVIDAQAAAPLVSNFGSLALLVWLAGFLFISIRLAGGIARLAVLSAHSQPLSGETWTSAVRDISKGLKITRSVRVLMCSSEAAMPLTWGIFRPLIILPAAAREWPAERSRIVICHELAHVARRDWLLQICAELTRGFYWFHPLAWIAARRLRQESERACDDLVLNCGFEPSDYASQLLDVARGLKNSSSAWSAALAIARPSNLERRFASMLNPSLNHSPLSVRLRFATVLSALCLLLPLAALRLPAQNLSLTGTVYDPSGAPVANATVIMTEHKTNRVKMTTSGGEGYFAFAALPAGGYEMKVVKPGFAEYNVPQIALEPNRESSQNVTLNPASVMEEVDVIAEGAARPVTGEETRKPASVRLGGDIQAAKLLNKVQPIYPASAKAGGTQGTVILHAVIGMEGTPLSLKVMNSQVDPELARAAVEAVSKWRYSPTLLNGEPIEVDTTIAINFRLLS